MDQQNFSSTLDFHFGAIPETLLHTPLSSHAKLIIACLTLHSFRGDMCWPSLQRLQKLSSLSRASVQRALRELRKHNLLLIQKRPGHSSLYKLIQPVKSKPNPIQDVLGKFVAEKRLR